MNNKVSIIIPVYNAESFLERTIVSILSQDYTEFELILVDDGSKDTSAEIMRHYQELDSRVIALFQDNSGAPIARNYGLSVAEGEFIQFIDSDDFMADGGLSHMVQSLKNSGADIAIGLYDTVDENEKFIKSVNISLDPGTYAVSDNRAVISLLPPMPGNKLFRSSLIRGNGLEFEPSLRQAQDLNFYLKTLLFAEDVVIVDAVTYHYRIRSGSISHTYSLVILEVIRSIKDVRVFYLNNGFSDEQLFSNLMFHHYNFQIQKIPQIVNQQDRKKAMKIFKKEFKMINRDFLLPQYRGKKYWINKLKMTLEPLYLSQMYTNYQNKKAEESN